MSDGLDKSNSESNQMMQNSGDVSATNMAQSAQDHLHKGAPQ